MPKKPTKSFKKLSINTEEKHKRFSPAQLAQQEKMRSGEISNPAGRPKGSRNRFAEAFIADFLHDWEAHGSDALRRCREIDPAAYVKVGATLLPKDFNLNMTNEANLDKLLDQFTNEELDQLIAGLVAAGTGSKQKTIEARPRTESDELH